MFLGVVSTIDKDLSKQNLNKNDEKTIHLCDRANELTTIVLKNADNLSFGDLVILDVKDDCYKFEKLELSSDFDENLLIQLYNLIENEKLMLKSDQKVFKHNFGDFGKLGEEIFYCFSNRNRLIQLLNNKFSELLLKVKINPNNKNYFQIQCLKIIGEVQFLEVDLIHWTKYAITILNLLNSDVDIDNDLLIKTIESLLNVYVDDLDKNQLKIQLEQELRDKLNELKGNQKKLV